MLDATGSTAQPRGRWVGLAQAARILNVSRETVRRRVVAGQLEATREERPQGTVWRVRLPVGPAVERPPMRRGAPHEQAHQEPAAPVASSPVEAVQPVEATPTPVEPASDLAPLVATLGAALAGLAGQLEAARADLTEARLTADRRAGEVADLREQRGRLTAELERAASTVVALNDQLAAADRSRQRDVRRLSIALAVLAVLAIAAMLAPAWVR